MPENTYRESPIVSPDSLRQALHLDKSLFEIHTKKQFGREDINGSQYVGTVENFGDEMLLETRKMRMMKPSLSHVICNSNVQHFFKLEYADEIPTYYQWNMFTLILKKDVICNGHDAEHPYPKLIFRNCHLKAILRSEHDSETTDDMDSDLMLSNPVFKSFMYETTDPPVVSYENGLEYPLQVQDPHDGEVRYGFYVDTDSMPDEYPTYEMDLDETMVDMPCVWIWLETYNTLPKLKMVDNIDHMGRPLLEIGTNSRNMSFLYPMTYGESNLPTTDIAQGCSWQIRVYARDHLFTTTDGNPYTNLNTDIEEVRFVQYPGDFSAQIPYIWSIIFRKDDHIHITLNPDLKWNFRMPQSGDHDYDGITYRNYIYGYLNNIDQLFQTNGTNVSTDNPMIPLLRVHFDDDYYHEMNTLIENAVSGVHVDYTSDYTEHGVIKENGVIYQLDRFEGLPFYYYSFYDENIKHPRVSIYSIRDYINKRNQQIDDKHVSALIVDGGMPNFYGTQSDVDLDSVIKFAWDPTMPRTYRTIDDSVKPANAMSDMAYLPPDTDEYRALCEQHGFPEGTLIIVDTTMPEYTHLKDRFIYHGNRTFSTYVSEFDPYLETARVYYISNDPIEYENNATSDCVKPGRTLARICDIPTDFSQLQHLDGYSPTFVADKKYVRAECDYSWDDANRIQELNRDIHYAYAYRYYNNGIKKPHHIFENDENLDDKLYHDYVHGKFSRKSNLDTSLNMSDLDSRYISATSTDTTNGYIMRIHVPTTSENTGSPYSKYRFGDIVSIMIGAQSIDFRVVSTLNGNIILIGHCNGDINIPLANLESRIYTYTALSQNTRLSDQPMYITLEITNEKWNEMQPTQTLLSNIYTIKRDKVGNLIEYKYNGTSWVKGVMLSGADIVNNEYDIRYHIPDADWDTGSTTAPYSTEYYRDVDNTYFYDVLSFDHITSEDYAYDALIKEYSILNNEYVNPDAMDQFYVDVIDGNVPYDTSKIVEVENTGEYDDNELDQSNYITDAKMNIVNGYYLMHRVDDTHRRLIPLTLMTNKMTYNPKIFPEYHHAIVSHYQPTTNEFTRLSEHLFKYDQPELILYNPYQTSYISYIQLGADLYEREDNPITFNDLSHEYFKNTNTEEEPHYVPDGNKLMNMIRYDDNSKYVLKENVYKFDFYQIPSEQRGINALLQHGDEPALLTYIKMMISKTALPVIYQDTAYAFTRDKLVGYILENLPRKYAYDQNIHENETYITKIRSANDEVAKIGKYGRYVPSTEEKTWTEYIRLEISSINPPHGWPEDYYMDAYGDKPVSIYTPGIYYKKTTKTETVPTIQPTGEYYSVTRRVFHAQHKVGTMNVESSPLFILRVDGDFRKLENFHMIDDVTGIDISENTLLIHNNVLYMYYPSQDTWLPIKRKEV